MSYEPSSENWYALFVETGKEDDVKKQMERRFEEKFRLLVPKRKLIERKGAVWSNVIRTLFPGYVLLNGDIGVEEYYQFKGMPGLIKLLRSGYDPLRIEYEEIGTISKLTYNNEIIGLSNVLMENGKVTVIDGPLQSLEGLIVSINRRKGRAKVRLGFLGEERTVELGVSVLQPG